MGNSYRRMFLNHESRAMEEQQLIFEGDRDGSVLKPFSGTREVHLGPLRSGSSSTRAGLSHG